MFASGTKGSLKYLKRIRGYTLTVPGTRKGKVLDSLVPLEILSLEEMGRRHITEVDLIEIKK